MAQKSTAKQSAAGRRKAITDQTPAKSPAKIPDEVIAEQLRLSRGNITHAAKALGMHRCNLHVRISATPALAEVVADAREAIVDAAENALYAAVTEKQGWAVCFTLKTLGKSRGYIERHELEHSGQIATQITVIEAVKPDAGTD